MLQFMSKCLEALLQQLQMSEEKLASMVFKGKAKDYSRQKITHLGFKGSKPPLQVKKCGQICSLFRAMEETPWCLYLKCGTILQSFATFQGSGKLELVTAIQTRPLGMTDRGR